jgi:hypothetical protein
MHGLTNGLTDTCVPDCRSGAFQVTYIGNTTRKRGLDYGNPPTATVVLSPGEQITNVFGSAWWFIVSIGFTTSSGTVYGPWGDWNGGWSKFSLDGPVYGFYGGWWGSDLSGIGIWTTNRTTTPPPTPNPGINPRGMMRSRMFGGSLSTDSQWDDGSTFAGSSLAHGWSGYEMG